MHFSTENADDITDLAHDGMCLIAPALNNLVGAVRPNSERASLSEPRG